MNIEIFPAQPQQRQTLANLLELYAYDFSEFIDIRLGPGGRFGYENLDLYWQAPDHFPFLIEVDHDLAGFVLVRRGSLVSGNPAVFDVAEFFITRAHRRCGVGTRVAHDIWNRFPGSWEVRVMKRNREAGKFWRAAVRDFSKAPVSPAAWKWRGEDWQVFSFTSVGRMSGRLL